MKNICVIGDSHTAALRVAWIKIRREFPDINITFFSSQRRLFGDLAVRGDALVPEKAKLREAMMRSCKFEPVIASDYDRYVLCGLDFSTVTIMSKLGRFRSEEQVADYRAPLSSECYLRAMTGCLRSTVSFSVGQKVRAITSRPMTIVPGPHVSDATRLKLYPRLNETGDAERIAGYFFSASDIIGEELGADISRQPPQTLCDPLRTLAAYGQNAPREFTDKQHPEGWPDYHHMNGDYGACVLRALFASPRF